MTSSIITFDFSTPITEEEAKSILHLTSSQYNDAFQSGALPVTGVVRVFPPCRTRLHTMWDLLHHSIMTQFPSSTTKWSAHVVSEVLDTFARGLEYHELDDNCIQECTLELSSYVSCACQRRNTVGARSCCISASRTHFINILQQLTASWCTYFSVELLEGNRYRLKGG
jgi:hypothetical protein